MTSDIDMDDINLKVRNSVRYFVNEHGDNAVAEAQAAVLYAQNVKDQTAAVIFKAALQQLAKQRSE